MIMWGGYTILYILNLSQSMSLAHVQQVLAGLMPLHIMKTECHSGVSYIDFFEPELMFEIPLVFPMVQDSSI